MSTRSLLCSIALAVVALCGVAQAQNAPVQDVPLGTIGKDYRLETGPVLDPNSSDVAAPAPVPEPATGILLVSGAIAGGLLAWRRRRIG